MRTLKFIVSSQIVAPDPDCDMSNLVPGGKECIKLEFIFSKDWNGYTKVVEFTSALGKEYTPKMLTDGRSCIVPAEALSRRVFKIRVIGKQGEKKMVTNKFAIKQNGGKA